MLLVVEKLALAVAILFIVFATGFNVVTFVVAFARAPRPPRLAVAFIKELAATFLLIPLWPLYTLVGKTYAVAHREPSSEGDEVAMPPDAAAGQTTGATDGKGRKVSVILLHGFMMNQTNWVWFGRTLARRGIGPIHGMSYLTLASIERSAAKLGRFVDEVRARDGADQVDIVAHSLGGLVARFYIERLGGAQYARRLITIATPHRGTAWARIAPGFGRVHMQKGWPLPNLAPDGKGPRYTAIWSRCDNLVIPPESASFPIRDGAAERAGLDGAPVSAAELEADLEATAAEIDEVAFDDLGHLGLLVSPRVADAVARRLAA